jgi:hypothetical protein
MVYNNIFEPIQGIRDEAVYYCISEKGRQLL